MAKRRINSPGMRSITDPEARRHVSEVWGIDEKDLPGAGLTACEIMEAIHRGEIKGALLDVLQSRSSRCPTRTSRARLCRNSSSSA